MKGGNSLHMNAAALDSAELMLCLPGLSLQVVVG